MKRFYIMKLSKFTVVLAILLVSILAMGAVSAESVDDAGIVAVADGDIQDSVEVTDAVDDLSTADNADETVGDGSSAVLGDTTNSYDLDDDSYSTYFNEDGTATDALSADGDYTLNVGTLTNKDIKITSGSQINIIGKEGAGFINNGTIIIGDGNGLAGSITISGLTFTNFNKDGIAVNQLSSDITIDNNKFDLTYDDTYGLIDYSSPMAIVAYGYVDDVEITNNNIKMVTAAAYNYGIDFNKWLPDYSKGMGNAEHLFVANNDINITSTASFGMVEAFYIDTVANSVFKNNTINTYSGPGVVNYAIAVADSCGYDVMDHYFDDEYVGGDSPYNITIIDNNINIESGDMAYGITVISWSNTDIWFEEIIKDIVISNNDLTINSQTGAIGIGAQSSDVEITDNKVTINANADAQVTANPDPVFGDDSNAITILNFNEVLGYYYNTTVTDNIITTNVPVIFVDKTKGNGYYSPEPIVIEDNTITYTGAVEYTIDDDHYSLFFNDDGTPTDLLNPEGNYALKLGNLTNKVIKILTGSNINVTGVEGDSLTNSTIIIGDGAGSASAVIVKDLVIVNINKDGIVVNDESKDITVDNNNLNLTYDSTYSGSPMAIVIYGHSEDIAVTNNVINMETAATYNYGIDVSIYGPGYVPGSANAKNLVISDNTVNMHTTSATGMGEAIYLDTLTNSIVENNNIYVKTENDAANYGIALADSSNWLGDGVTAPYNVTIRKNTVYLDSNDMANGISVISAKAFEGSRNFVIADNDVTVNSAKGAHGIATYTPDVEISGNTVTVFANPDVENNAYCSNYLGNHSAAIFINNVDPNSNNIVKDNEIYTTVDKINYTNVEDEQLKPVIEDNTEQSSYIIDDDTYSTYFNDDGTIKDDAPISAGDALLLGDLTNKNFVIDTGLTIKGIPGKKLVNSKIKLVAGADGTVIDGLTIEYPELKYGAITLEEVNNVEITNNKIIVPSTTQTVYGIAINSGTNGCNNISINNNHINITGSKYVYGIDIWQDYSLENKHNNIMIFENEFFVTGTGGKMTEGIFVSNCNDVIIDGNDITATCDGPAYGIGTNYLFNAAIANNHITVGSDNMAYGITATTSGSDLIIRANEIDVVGVGAVGVGINNQTGAIIEDNTISIDGGNYTTITVSDSLGTANAGILVGEGNTDVKTSGNDVSEKTPLRSDTAIEANNITVTAAPSGNGSFEINLRTAGGMPLANQVVKVVFNNQMYELTTDAKGVALLPFALNKGGTYNVEVFYLGDDDYRGSDASAKITINKIATKTTASAKTYLATAKTKSFTATLKDANGNVLANKKVTFTVNGKTYTTNTNAKGVATVKLALTAAKTYTVTIKFAGDSVYAASTVSAKVKLNKEKTKITAPKKTFKRTAKTKKVVITLKNSKGKAIAKKKVTLIVNKKKYTVKTNKKGKATFKVKLTKKGTFKYTAKFAGDTQYKAVKKTGKIKIK